MDQFGLNNEAVLVDGSQHNCFGMKLNDYNLCEKQIKQILSQRMQEQTGFNFTEIENNHTANSQFKRQRQLYLAERNARKKEAVIQIKKEFSDSSSQGEGQPTHKQPIIIKQNINKEGSNTDSSKNTPEPETEFKIQREKYKNERLLRRKQAIVNKRQQFGSSSSDEQPVAKKQSIKIKQESKAQTSPKLLPYKEEESNNFGYASLEINLAKENKQQRNNLMLASVKLKEKHSQKKQIKERYEVEVPSKKGVSIWIECCLQFKQNSIELGDRVIPIYDITKAKMIIQPTQTGSFKIKLTVKEEDVYLAASSKKMNDIHFLDQYYYVFAKIVSLKLQLMGRKPVNSPRIKSGLSEEILKEARLTGKLRKSSFFGGWQQKIGVISEKGLSIYKQGKDKPNLVVSPRSVRQIWTRFESQKDSVIIKFLNGSSKLELSIPIDNFLSRDNWLYQIYTLTPK